MPSAARNLQKRAMWTRTDGDMLTDWMEPPVGVYWLGSDAGGGLTPIGPHGPFAGGTGPAKPVVTRATSLITGPICSAAFKVLELGFGGQPQPRPRWITDPMLCRADERFPTSDIYPQVLRLSRAQFWVEWLRSAIWWGLGAFVYIEDAFGQPVAGSLKNIAPYTLTTQRTDDGLVWVIGDTQDASNQVIADRDGRLKVGPITYRLCVLRNPHSPVDCEGMSQGVFAMNPSTFMLSGQIDSYASGTFRSGVPAGYLQVQTPGLQQTQADELKRSWLAAHGGDRRSIAVLNAVTSFTPLSISPVDAALGEVKRLNIGDTAMAFGIDPEVLGVSLGNNATYKNIAEYWERHRDFGIALWTAGVEDTLTALLPGTTGVKVNLDGFAAPPLSERVTTGAAAVAAGLMTVNEWRELEGLVPLPDPPAPVPVPVPVPEPAAIEPPIPEPTPITRSAPAWLR